MPDFAILTPLAFVGNKKKRKKGFFSVELAWLWQNIV